MTLPGSTEDQFRPENFLRTLLDENRVALFKVLLPVDRGTRPTNLFVADLTFEPSHLLDQIAAAVL